MTRILHLTHTSVPSDARIQRQLTALQSLPDSQLYSYGVWLAADTKRPRPVGLSEFHLASDRASWLPRPVRYALVLIELNVRMIYRMRSIRPEIVHCHDTMVLPSGAIAAQLFKSRLIYDAHELESDKAGQTASLSRATLAIERAAWRFVDALISVSPSILDWYEKNLGAKRAECILNAPEIRKVSPDSGFNGNIREVLGLSRATPLFVYVGALVGGRGIELLMDTFRAPGTQAHIAFVGDGRLESEIVSLSSKYPNIHHVPPVPHDLLVPLIRSADGAFCLIEDVSLSDRYCLPNKLFECAFAGLPIIASKLPDISRIVREYHLGSCVEHTSEAVLAAIDEVLAMPRPLDVSHLGPLSWESQADKLLALYEELRDSGVASPTEGASEGQRAAVR